MSPDAIRRMEAWRQRLLGYLDKVREAVRFRDREGLESLLATDDARHLPRSVREEVLAMVREPRDSFRVPVRLLQFFYAIGQLRDDEQLTARSGPQLELELSSCGPGARARQVTGTPGRRIARAATRARGR